MSEIPPKILRNKYEIMMENHKAFVMQHLWLDQVLYPSTVNEFTGRLLCIDFWSM